MKKLAYLFVFSSLLFSACSTDLVVIGDYKETMVIYGLLDQSQAKQYVKINKAFLGEGDANTFAMVKDSTQYNHALNVVLKYFKNGIEQNSYTLSPDSSIQKDPGVFYGPDQANAIYSVATPSVMQNGDGEYHLIVKNNETGTTATGSTLLIGNAGISVPSALTPTFNFILPGNDDYTFLVRWNTAKNARIYQLVVRLNYTDSTETGNVSQHVDWVFPTQETISLSGSESFKGDFQGQAFMRFIGNQLNDYSGLVSRKVETVELLLTAGSDDLSTFIKVNKPSTSVAQEKPEYTNISNGLGIFASRYSQQGFARPLSATTIDTLSCGRYTKQLKFLNHLGMHPCQ